MRNGLIKRIVLFFAGLLTATTCFSQVQDANLWIYAGIEKKIIPGLSVNLNQEFRMNENFTELGTFFTDAGVTYKINKYLKISANYRFINKRRSNDSYSMRHRYYFDLTLRKKFNPVVITLRTRFQSQYTDVLSSADGEIPANHIRNKLMIKYDDGRSIKPYFYAEIYSPLKRPYDIFLDNTRYCAGLEYEINRMNTIDLFYMFQKEYHVVNPGTDHIIGIGYNISL
ncbi:MAG TPA: DUF2490 domain-containing protein [Bacteroidales bacterium]|nr:DUF2490 domain-containing protein [Bacteroidales bacterium]